MFCNIMFLMFLQITGGTHYNRAERVQTCNELVIESIEQELDPAITISVAWLESRWMPDAHNKNSGARGPLQMLPKYWCPDARGRWSANGHHMRTCDYTKWGVHALHYYVSRRKTLERALSEFGYTNAKSKYVQLGLGLTEVARIWRGPKTMQK